MLHRGPEAKKGFISRATEGEGLETKAMKMAMYLEVLRDEVANLHCAELQFLGSVHHIRDSARNPDLRNWLKVRRDETIAHVKRLEQVIQICGGARSRRNSSAIQSMLEDCGETCAHPIYSEVLDFRILLSVQRVTCYKLAGYEVSMSLAYELDQRDAGLVLEMSLGDEREASQSLADLASDSLYARAA